MPAGCGWSGVMIFQDSPISRKARKSRGWYAMARCGVASGWCFSNRESMAAASMPTQMTATGQLTHLAHVALQVAGQLLNVKGLHLSPPLGLALASTAGS